MNQQKNILVAIVSGFAVAGLGLYVLMITYEITVAGLDSETRSKVLVACVTLLLGAGIFARGMSRSSVSPDLTSAARESLYERLLANWSDACHHGRKPHEFDIDGIERLLILRASKNVIHSHLRLRAMPSPLDTSDPTTRAALQQLIAEMRRDLGHRELPWFPATGVDLIFRQYEPSEADSEDWSQAPDELENCANEMSYEEIQP